ncbi:MAG: Cache 3/Cache 2 fusion domain-containing protein, partial [Treponemataceae bacterium]
MNFKSIRTPLVLLICAVSAIPIAVLGSVAYTQLARVEAIAERESNALAYADLDHILSGIVGMAEAQRELLIRSAASDFEVMLDQVSRSGGVTLGKSKISVTATNQVTGTSALVAVFPLLVGGQSINLNADPAVPSSIVDRVRELTGSYSTLFVRMNEEGDMLRMVTN